MGKLKIKMGGYEDDPNDYDFEAHGVTRKSKTVSQKTKGKRKNKGRSGVQKRISSSGGLSNQSARSTAGFGKAVVVLITTIRLVLAFILSLVRGRERRKLAKKNLTKWIKTGITRIRNDPLFVFKMLIIYGCMTVLFMTVLSMLGIKVSTSLGSTSTSTSQLRLFIFRSNSVSEAQASSLPVNANNNKEGLDDDIPEQKAVERKKITKKEEIKFACVEVDCIEKCATKTTKKCKSSESCMKDRARSCRKKCRKKRCEDRCKLEPQLGYVEREMKRDKCKEGCHGDSRCTEKCDRDSQLCKTRCAERRKKFSCDRQPNIPFPQQGIGEEEEAPGDEQPEAAESDTPEEELTEDDEEI